MRFGAYEVQVTERANCRHLILRCQPGTGRLTLSVPPRTTQKKVREFLEAHRDWIEAHAKPAMIWQPTFAPGERHWVFGEQVVLGEGAVPCGEAAFLQWRTQQLAELLPRLTAHWAAQMQVTPARLRLRDMTSRWGSCQVRTHDITFNLRLAAMPIRCVEYVVVHELCHLIHPDHSAAFHAEMDRFLPDWRARRQQLNHFDPTPLAPAR